LASTNGAALREPFLETKVKIIREEAYSRA